MKFRRKSVTLSKPFDPQIGDLLVQIVVDDDKGGLKVLHCLRYGDARCEICGGTECVTGYDATVIQGEEP